MDERREMRRVEVDVRGWREREVKEAGSEEMQEVGDTIESNLHKYLSLLLGIFIFCFIFFFIMFIEDIYLASRRL